MHGFGKLRLAEDRERLFVRLREVCAAVDMGVVETDDLFAVRGGICKDALDLAPGDVVGFAAGAGMLPWVHGVELVLLVPAGMDALG